MTLHWRLALLAASCATAFGGTWVVPNTNTAGNQAVPIGTKAKRLQQIVGSGQFPGAMVITGIRLRAVPGTGPVSWNVPSLMVTVSTTQAYPNTNNGRTLPSTTFASNTGPDAKTVYNAAFSASSTGCTGGGPCPFDIAVPFNAPFSFDPAKGRLLVDIVGATAAGTPTGSLDGVAFPDSTTSSTATVSGDPTQTSGNLSLNGLVLGLDTTTPIINAVANAASNLTFNAPIAQGAIFIVQGVSLGPASIAIAPTAFQSTTLSGTSVAVTVGGTTVNAPMYYTSDGQLAGLLPSNTPTGSGTLTVTYSGQTSSQASISVVSSNPGIFTIDSTGQGPGIVTFADYSLVSAAKAANCGGPSSACGSANPGDTLILWATGLGPVSGSDASGAGLGQNMPNVPLKLWLGGVQAPVVYQGRSGCCIGEDQIVFTVPNNVPTGCAVPLVIQIGTTAGTISNSTVMPVATGSRNCTPSNAALASVNLEQAVMAGPVSYGNVKLHHDLNDKGTYQDFATFQFFKILSYNPGTQPFFLSWVDDLPPGTCIVYPFTGGGNPPISSLAPLDAGSSFTVKGSKGSVTVNGTPGQFNGTLDQSGGFLAAGQYTIAGTGGRDVSAFSGTIAFPVLPTLVSPVNPTTVTRSNGLTVTWSGGSASGNEQILVSSATDSSFTNGSQALCIPPASAGSFAVPSYVLLALPAGNLAGLQLSPAQVSVPSTATGLTLGLLQTHIDGVGPGLTLR
jgi:uncharacterized protein (TIGR03437 family)